MIRKDIDGRATEADGRDSALAGTSVATPLSLGNNLEDRYSRSLNPLACNFNIYAENKKHNLFFEIKVYSTL